MEKTMSTDNGIFVVDGESPFLKEDNRCHGQEIVVINDDNSHSSNPYGSGPATLKYHHHHHHHTKQHQEQQSSLGRISSAARLVLVIIREQYNQFGRGMDRAAIESTFLTKYQRKKKKEERTKIGKEKRAARLSVPSTALTATKSPVFIAGQSLQTQLSQKHPSCHSIGPLPIARAVSIASNGGNKHKDSISRNHDVHRLKLIISEHVRNGLNELERRGVIELCRVDMDETSEKKKSKKKKKNTTKDGPVVSLTLDGICALYDFDGDPETHERILCSKEGPTNLDVQTSIRAKLSENQNHIINLIFDRRCHSRQSIFQQLDKIKQDQMNQQQQNKRFKDDAGTMVSQSHPLPEPQQNGRSPPSYSRSSSNSKLPLRPKPSRPGSTIRWSGFAKDLTLLRKMGIIDYPSPTEIQMTDYLFPFGP